jgi:hypothetical protein
MEETQLISANANAISNKKCPSSAIKNMIKGKVYMSPAKNHFLCLTLKAA